MQEIHEGQCGLCAHFGEHSNDQQQNEKLIQLQTTRKAEEDFLDVCGHPTHEGLHLRVSVISGCDGFQNIEEFQNSRT